MTNKVLEKMEKINNDMKPKDRRVTKPLIERRRRERINGSLRNLKSILEMTFKNQIPRDSKMEKADILELTVNHLRNTQRRQLYTAATTDPTVMDKYRAGFSECANEITRFLSAVDGVSDDLRTRVLGHLSNQMNALNPQYTCAVRPQWQSPVIRVGLPNMNSTYATFQNTASHSTATWSPPPRHVISSPPHTYSNTPESKFTPSPPEFKYNRQLFSSPISNSSFYNVNIAAGRAGNSPYGNLPQSPPDLLKDLSKGHTSAFKPTRQPIVVKEEPVVVTVKIEPQSDENILNNNNNNRNIGVNEVVNNDNYVENDENGNRVEGDENMWRPW